MITIMDWWTKAWVKRRISHASQYACMHVTTRKSRKAVTHHPWNVGLIREGQALLSMPEAGATASYDQVVHGIVVLFSDFRSCRVQHRVSQVVQLRHVYPDVGELQQILHFQAVGILDWDQWVEGPEDNLTENNGILTIRNSNSLLPRLQECQKRSHTQDKKPASSSINHKYYNFLQSDWSIKPLIRA